MRPAHVCVLAALSLAACGTPSQDVYNPDEVGQIHEIQEGTVVTARAVDIEAPDSTSGSTVGSLAGGIGTVLAVGGQLGPLGFLIGSAVGGVIGYIVEDMATDGSGIEYILTLDDGRVVTVVQNAAEGEEPLPEGSAVYVQFSSNYVRVLKRPEIAPKPGIWINPDDGPTGGRPKAKAPLDGPVSAAAAAPVQETPAEASPEAPAEASPEVPAEAPAEVPAEASAEVSAGVWANPDGEAPAEAGAEPLETAADTRPAPLPRVRPDPPEARLGQPVPEGL